MKKIFYIMNNNSARLSNAPKAWTSKIKWYILLIITIFAAKYVFAAAIQYPRQADGVLLLAIFVWFFISLFFQKRNVVNNSSISAALLSFAWIIITAVDHLTSHTDYIGFLPNLYHPILNKMVSLDFIVMSAVFIISIVRYIKTQPKKR